MRVAQSGRNQQVHRLPDHRFRRMPEQRDRAVVPPGDGSIGIGLNHCTSDQLSTFSRLRGATSPSPAPSGTVNRIAMHPSHIEAGPHGRQDRTVSVSSPNLIPRSRDALRRRGIALEVATLGWNVVAVPLLGFLAAAASSVALLGFGLDSLIEIGASAVVIWELTGAGEQRRQPALRLIGVAFLALAAYLLVQSVVALAVGHRATPSGGGLIWTGVTAVVMFGLAAGKSRTGRALGNEVLISEGRVTRIDGLLASAVLIGLALDLLLGWWWADPLAGLVLVLYAAREAIGILRPSPAATDPGPER
jgi:hypothetical protein